MRTKEACRSGRGGAGFTLVEILAVLAILGLLMSMAIYYFGTQTKKGYVTKTRAAIAQLEMLITSYERRFGEAPPDSLAKLKIRAENDANEGAEALYAALHHKDFPEGQSADETLLGNTDDDSTSTPYHRNGVTLLLELEDAWGNPIAYIKATSYGRQFHYVMGEDAEPADADQVITAQKSGKTQIWARPDAYQLISAGSDHKFGTDDDVTNFK
jgi:prepilin-type N-terminal cleavage/methylation domain-containing protein